MVSHTQKNDNPMSVGSRELGELEGGVTQREASKGGSAVENVSFLLSSDPSGGSFHSLSLSFLISKFKIITSVSLLQGFNEAQN